MYLIKNGIIYTMGNEGVVHGDILVAGGKIKAVGADLFAPDAEVLDVSGCHVYPGLIDAHCHLGMEESGIRKEGDDVNEHSDPVTPHMRAIDAINPMDETIERARQGGITTVCSGPGSANVLGGTFLIYKTYGTCIDEMIVKNPAAMKCAFGENPKMGYMDSSIKTRMKIAALLRETLFKTQEYIHKKAQADGDVHKMPPYDMKLEAMIPVLEKKIPLKAHAHRADDILTAIRIAKEFDLDMTLDHCTEGHLILDQVKASGFDAIVGPSLTHKSKFELKNLTFDTAGILQKGGIRIAVNTDSPVIPEEYLPICAGLAAKAGLGEEEALKAITIHAAEILKVDDRIGSIEVGKDADLVITKGNIMEINSHVHYTFINGKIVYRK